MGPAPVSDGRRRAPDAFKVGNGARFPWAYWPPIARNACGRLVSRHSPRDGSVARPRGASRQDAGIKDQELTASNGFDAAAVVHATAKLSARSFSLGRRIHMLATIAVILVVCWLLGFLVFHVSSFLIHILLIVAVIMIVMQVVRGRGSSV
jgi:hypothetical protein